MEEEKNNDTEDFLKEFSLRAVPPALKEKILENDYGKRGSNHVIRMLWNGVAVCLVLSIIVIAVDAAISRVQQNQLSSFLDKQQDSIEKQEEDWSMLKDIIGGWVDSPSLNLKRALAEREKTNWDKERRNEWREILKEELE